MLRATNTATTVIDHRGRSRTACRALSRGSLPNGGAGRRSRLCVVGGAGWVHVALVGAVQRRVVAGMG
jgi:apolipoprotein N-acyltransferase